MTVLLYLIFFALLFGVGVWVAAFVRRRVAPKNQRRATIVVWLAILAIPFWDVIPATAYFNYQCRNAGVEILDKSYPKDVYLPAGESPVTQQGKKRFVVERVKTTDPSTGLVWSDWVYLDSETRVPVIVRRGIGHSTELSFGITRWEELYLHPETRVPLIRQRNYRGPILGGGYWKPWLYGLTGECPPFSNKSDDINQKIKETFR